MSTPSTSIPNKFPLNNRDRSGSSANSQYVPMVDILQSTERPATMPSSIQEALVYTNKTNLKITEIGNKINKLESKIAKRKKWCCCHFLARYKNKKAQKKINKYQKEKTELQNELQKVKGETENELKKLNLGAGSPSRTGSSSSSRPSSRPSSPPPPLPPSRAGSTSMPSASRPRPVRPAPSSPAPAPSSPAPAPSSPAPAPSTPAPAPSTPAPAPSSPAPAPSTPAPAPSSPAPAPSTPAPAPSTPTPAPSSPTGASASSPEDLLQATINSCKQQLKTVDNNCGEYAVAVAGALLGLDIPTFDSEWYIDDRQQEVQTLAVVLQEEAYQFLFNVESELPSGKANKLRKHLDTLNKDQPYLLRTGPLNDDGHFLCLVYLKNAGDEDEGWYTLDSLYGIKPVFDTEDKISFQMGLSLHDSSITTVPLTKEGIPDILSCLEIVRKTGDLSDSLKCYKRKNHNPTTMEERILSLLDGDVNTLPTTVLSSNEFNVNAERKEKENLFILFEDEGSITKHAPTDEGNQTAIDSFEKEHNYLVQASIPERGVLTGLCYNIEGVQYLYCGDECIGDDFPGYILTDSAGKVAQEQKIYITQTSPILTHERILTMHRYHNRHVQKDIK